MSSWTPSPRWVALLSSTNAMNDSADIEQELKEIAAESIGWIPLENGAYLHAGAETQVIQVVGVADASMAGTSVLWLV